MQGAKTSCGVVQHNICGKACDIASGRLFYRVMSEKSQ